MDLKQQLSMEMEMAVRLPLLLEKQMQFWMALPLPMVAEASDVKLFIYDVRGRLINTLTTDH